MLSKQQCVFSLDFSDDIPVLTMGIFSSLLVKTAVHNIELSSAFTHSQKNYRGKVLVYSSTEKKIQYFLKYFYEFRKYFIGICFLSIIKAFGIMTYNPSQTIPNHKSSVISWFFT